MVEDGEGVLHGQLVPAAVGGEGRCTFEELAVVRSRGEEEGASWQVMKYAGERPVHTRNVGSNFTCEWFKAKKFREDAQKEK